MKELDQLVEVLSPNKLKEIAVISPTNKSMAKVNQLYNLIAKGDYSDENELIDILFKKTANQRANFNRTKRELKERLINSLFLIDANQKKYPDISQAYYLCYKYATAVKILLGKGARGVAISIAERAFKIAERFEFTDILLTLSKDLRVHYGNLAGDKKMFSFYNNKVHYYSKVLMAELKAEEYYSALTLTFSLSRSSKDEFKEMAQSYGDELESIISLYNSYRFNLTGYLVIVLRYEFSNEYEKTIEACDRALNFFENKKHLTTSNAKFSFYFRKISSQILLSKLYEAEETTQTCLKLVEAGLFNWFKTQEYRFILFSHSKNYHNAFEVYKEVISNNKFTKQYSYNQEAWYIYEAYIYYFYLRQAFKSPLNERLKKFRLNKFLNEVPTYSKDKRGMNIAILILQVLFLLHQKQYGKIIDRTEALRTYTHRYLRRDETFRSNCFIKMLMQLPKANFHRAAVERKTKELREKLSSVGIIQNQSAEVEIVPYEVLWEFVLESLDNKIH